MTQQKDHVPDGRKKVVTAVEWLLEQIEIKNGKEFSSYYSEFIEQAKAMEKEQLNIARLDGINLANKGYGK